jgi:radical SAM family uncharacterized protein/radical SAM-linked protein
MKIDDLLIRVQAPIRYLNREVNSRRKNPEPTQLKAALCFPDLYEIGISHLGHRLLYHILNNRPEILCDRAYSPWPDFAELLKKEAVPYYGIESKIPLKDFDLIGFTLPNELCYSNILQVLDLARIPLRAEERREGKWPLVIGGGPCASNPEPVYAFFDAFFFGEADAAILEIAELMINWKKQGDGNRESLLKELAKIQGVYVPEFYEPVVKNGRLVSIAAKNGAPEKVRRRIVPDLDQSFFPVRELVPFAEAVHDRYVIEIARGCTRGCRFCHAGIIYRPYRERSPDQVLELARQGLKATGFEECSLLSLSAGDYSAIEELIVDLIVEHYRERVSVSLPSLRVSSLSPVLLQAIRAVRKTGFTIAPEAGTERLRRALNKPITDQEIMDTARKVLEAGWRTLKFYFMIGLPTETEDDIAGIARLAKSLSAMARRTQPGAQLNLSVSGFIPKPHTPFQWEKQAGIDELFEMQRKLKQELYHDRSRLRMENPETSFLEGVFARGGRELSEVIEAAHAKGLCFDGWTEHFKFDKWMETFREKGLDPEQYLKARDHDCIFPFEHLDSGVSREFMVAEREAAAKGETTDDCRLIGCNTDCGVCDQELIAPRVARASAKKSESLLENLDHLPAQPDIFFRYLVHYTRTGDLRFIGLLENNRMFLRMVRRAGLPMRYSQGYHPLPRISFSPAPPVGVESEAEYVELEILERLSVEKIRAALQAAMPEGMKIVELKELSLKAPSISQVISLIDYLAVAPDPLKPRFAKDKVDEFLARDSLVIEQKRDKKTRSLDLRQKVKSMELTPENHVRFSFIISQGPGAKPQELVAAVFGLNEDELTQIRYTRTAVHFREQRPVEYPGSPMRGRPVSGGRK